MTPETPQILIVGAGPSGLVLALWLQRLGVSFRIIDQSSKPGETSRALAVQARTLEFYQQLGIAERLIEAGILVREITFRRRGKVIAKAPLGAAGEGMSPFPYLLFLSQDVHERLLVAELERLGVTIERETELVSLTELPNNLTATIKTKSGLQMQTYSYICGCDGAHSVVRHSVGIEFPGGTYSQVFYVADVLAQGDMANADLQISVSQKDFCIIMPIKSLHSTRLTGVVPPECESKPDLTFADVALSVQRNTGLSVQKVNWFSSYRVHHRVASHFRHGRVFLVGDAGHIHSPAGGQGMNTGIGDAINLAWKLAQVSKGRAPESMLASYETERIAFARVLVRTTDTAFSVIASRTLIGSLFRAYILPGLFSILARIRPLARLAFRVISQIRIQYSDSPLNTGRLPGPLRPGQRLPWVNDGAIDNFKPLQSLAWQIHLFGQATSQVREAAAVQDLSVHEFPWSKAAREKGFARDFAYLIRPDGHIAGAFDPRRTPVS
jgi:2-polyprenyl-6-methoxyphenol hydroxylase-like FAD-dependent oxidoreductase